MPMATKLGIVMTWHEGRLPLRKSHNPFITWYSEIA